jgi:hypothetical protein
MDFLMKAEQSRDENVSKFSGESEKIFSEINKIFNQISEILFFDPEDEETISRLMNDLDFEIRYQIKLLKKLRDTLSFVLPKKQYVDFLRIHIKKFSKTIPYELLKLPVENYHSQEILDLLELSAYDLRVMRYPKYIESFESLEEISKRMYISTTFSSDSLFLPLVAMLRYYFGSSPEYKSSENVISLSDDPYFIRSSQKLSRILLDIGGSMYKQFLRDCFGHEKYNTENSFPVRNKQYKILFENMRLASDYYYLSQALIKISSNSKIPSVESVFNIKKVNDETNHHVNNILIEDYKIFNMRVKRGSPPFSNEPLGYLEACFEDFREWDLEKSQREYEMRYR